MRRRVIERDDAVEKRAHFFIAIETPSDREDRFSQRARQPRDTGRTFAFQGLAIEAPFTRDHIIGLCDLPAQIDRLGDDFETGTNFRAAESQQTKSQTARGARAGNFTQIGSAHRAHVRQARQTALQNLDRFPTRAFLWAENARRAARAEERIADVGRAGNRRQREFVRPRDARELFQITRPNNFAIAIIEKAETQRARQATAAIVRRAAAESEDDVRAPRSAAARSISPTPKVEARNGLRSLGEICASPAAALISMTAACEPDSHA